MKLTPIPLLCAIALCSTASGAPVLAGASGTFTFPATSGPFGSGPGIIPTVTTTLTGTDNIWTPTPPGYSGTYTTVGFPSGSSNALSWDFSGLQFGYLPAGAYFRMSDFDSNEDWSFTGFGVGGAALTAHWLTDVVHVEGAPADLQQSFMPTWAFNSGTGLYQFTGETASGNPAIFVVLQTTANLESLTLTRGVASNGLTFGAEVPEPSSVALLMGAIVALGLRRTRSTWNRSA